MACDRPRVVQTATATCGVALTLEVVMAAGKVTRVKCESPWLKAYSFLEKTWCFLLIRNALDDLDVLSCQCSIVSGLWVWEVLQKRALVHWRSLLIYMEQVARVL